VTETQELPEIFRTPPPPAGVELRERVAYGTAGRGGRELHLDLYAAPGERRPGVVFVHGGGWQNGQACQHIRNAAALAAHGYVSATIDYRLSDESHWPAPLEDVKAALRWMRANAIAIGMDPDRLAVAGDSAGGHLAAMAALTPGRFEGEGGNPETSSAVSAAVLWYPAVDLRRENVVPGIDEVVVKLAGADDPAVRAEASPILHVHGDCPPVLTMTGREDPVCRPEPIVDFHRALRAAGVDERLHVWDGLGHAFDFEPTCWQRSLDAYLPFLDSVLRP
jgi:acetyl esterase/lipase